MNLSVRLSGAEISLNGLNLAAMYSQLTSRKTPYLITTQVADALNTGNVGGIRDNRFFLTWAYSNTVITLFQQTQ